MQYIINVYLDQNARTVGDGGPNTNAKVPAHLWFKETGTGQGAKGWVPVADPLVVSRATDTVGFTLADVYGELTNNATYKICFTGASGSPLDSATTEALADGSYAWQNGHFPIAGLANPTDYVTSGASVPLANEGSFEFTVEVDDGSGTEVYYLDPRMIVDP